jgi:hypothetical protein
MKAKTPEASEAQVDWPGAQKPRRKCLTSRLKNDAAGEDKTEDEILTPEKRRELRRDTLRYARLLPPGAERNELRRVAQSLAFFEDAPTSNPVREESSPARRLLRTLS